MFYNKITNVKNMGSYFITYMHPVVQENNGEHGLSHLVEHCMCEPIKKFDKKMHEHGISWNAFTSSKNVCFFMSGLTKEVYKFIEDFTKNILEYEITEEVFERERKIVISEYLMYYNDLDECFSQNWNRKHFNYCSALGLLSDLKSITYEKFMEFKNRVFNKPSDIYYIHSKNTKDLNNEYINSIEYNTKKVSYNYKDFGEYSDYPIEYYSTGVNTQRILMFGQNLETKNHEDFIKKIALTAMFSYFMCGGLSSYLYQEIREKYACVYCIRGNNISLDDEKHNFVGFSCSTDIENVNLLTKVIHRCLKKLMKHITIRKFNSIYKHNDTKTKISNYTEYASYTKFCDDNMNEVQKLLDNKKITYNEFIEFANNFINSYKLYNNLDYIPENTTLN